MRDLTEAVNSSSDLADLEITSEEGTENTSDSPVLATPAAFMGGVVISAALVAAYEAGHAHGAGEREVLQ